MKLILKLCILIILGHQTLYAQDPIVEAIVTEAQNNSELEELAHELIDVVGPRLTGTPQINNAHNWLVDQYAQWDISASKEKWGEWQGWERGITHIDMIRPRVQSLNGTQLAWSPGTGNKGVSGEVVVFPEFNNYYDFKNWLPSVKGKFVMISRYQPTGRPDFDWSIFATPESFDKMKSERDSLKTTWNENMANTGYSNHRNEARLNEAGIITLEQAGAIGIISSYWSGGYGVNRIFRAYTESIPTIDMELEDYGMLYRLTESGNTPKINVIAKSRDLGNVPTFNTIAEIKGSEKPEEYVILSAHLDSWDGATGATDNGTGTVLMMEAMRILKAKYPNPKRTILAGHWSFEEGGLNGSRAFVEDNPEMLDNIQAVFNQDNGTGRVVELTGSGFLHTSDYLARWLSAVPEEVTQHIKTDFPGLPSGGGSDHSSFIAVEVPAFRLKSLEWYYRTYTWHTNRDTYDKVVFDELRNNVILAAVLAYMASEDPEKASNEKRDMPIDPDTGKQKPWPIQKLAKRSQGE